MYLMKSTYSTLAEAHTCTEVWTQGEGGVGGETGGCLESTKDLHIQSHGTLRKLKSAHAFISDTKGATEEKKLGKLC